MTLLLSVFRISNAQTLTDAEKDRLFRAGASQYETGRYAEAVAPLEKLVQVAPETFEVQELLGLVYAAQAQDAKANAHLAKAVRLKPRSRTPQDRISPRALSASVRFDLAIEQFSKAVELEPMSFEANHNLGEAYVHAGNLAKAVPYLEKAQQHRRFLVRKLHTIFHWLIC